MEHASSSDKGALKPTKDTYDRFQQAFDFFNRALFDAALPNCLITLQRRKRSYGYFAADRFGNDDGHLTDEIALNPSHFRSRPVTEVLATLVHEMVHLWQHHHGKPGRGRYHNRQWADRMKAVGLQPTDTGEEGGKEVGDRVHHLIVPDGPFDRAARKLTGRGFVLTWVEQPAPAAPSAAGAEAGEDAGKESRSGKRVKYTCPQCGLAAWAKHDAALICGADHAPLEPQT